MTGQYARYQQQDNVFKEYVVQMYLGQGGFGEVYQVVNDMGLPFALKVLHWDVNLVQQGAEAMMQVRSPRLVRIQDFGETRNGEGCILMEYVRNTLESVMADQNLKPEEAHHYLTEILKGLQTLHENGIIHRNIKPLNLFVQEDVVKIGDVGSARYTTGESKSICQGMATCHYLAPEQFTQTYSYGVDLWSAGVVFFRMLTGHHPFIGEDNPQLFWAIMQEEAVLKDVPKVYQTFVQRVFQKQPAKRYQTPADMLAGLGACIRSAGPARSRSAPAQTPKAPLRSAAPAPQAGDTFTESHTGMVFVYVPEGTFKMGGIFRGGHTVRLDGFWMGRDPVTVGQWQRFIENTGFSSDGENVWKCNDMALTELKQTDDHPVVCVSWKEAEAFARWLSDKSGAQFHLPTEAEWEYAARSGGRREIYAGGDDMDVLGWYDKNNDGSTQPVGQKAANGLGLHDMSGNVFEWCADWFDDDYYAVSPEYNPQGPSSGSLRVMRGGCWLFPADRCETTFRMRSSPVRRFGYCGFRLVRLPDQG